LNLYQKEILINENSCCIHNQLHAHQEGKEAYDTCLEVIKQLGETVPTILDPKSFVKKVETIQAKLCGMTEKDLMDMKTLDSPFYYSLMQFYNQMCFVSYFVNPPMLKWFTVRLMEITLEHGICRYSALGILRFTMILGGKLIHDIEGGYRSSKMAMKLIGRFDGTDLLPTANLIYYGYSAGRRSSCLYDFHGLDFHLTQHAMCNYYSACRALSILVSTSFFALSSLAF